MTTLIPFTKYNRPLAESEKNDLERLIRRNTVGIPVVAYTEIEDYLLALARSCQIDLDDGFLFKAVQATQFLGEANPKIPDPTSQAPMRLFMRDKLARAERFPLVSALSTPPARRFDFTGPVGLFRAASILCAAVADENGRVRTLADDVVEGGPFASAMAELIGSDRFGDLRSALQGRLAAAGQVSHVHPAEKQLYVPTGDGRYTMVTPLASNLAIELRRRLNERRKQGELFGELDFHVGGDNPINCGLSSALLAGDLPRLMCLPATFSEHASGNAEFMPPPRAGRFLVLRMAVHDMNATGTDLTAGFSLLTTAALGFSDALRLKMSGNVEIESVAIGLSQDRFRGEWLGDRWVYSQKCGVKTSARGVTRLPVPELLADATVHLVLQLDRKIDPESVSQNMLGEMTRFGGGSIPAGLQGVVTDQAGLDEVLAAWGSKVQMLADRSDRLAEADPLDRLLDAMAITQDAETVRWYRVHPGLVPVAAGYQGVEPPRPRGGLRSPDKGMRHMYAISLNGVAEFLPASSASCEPIWWQWEWQKASYSAVVTARKNINS